MPEPKSLDRERAYRKLVDLILSGKLTENTPLSERGLAESLELGRTPIREAIKDLVREGVLDTHPTRGTFIRPLSLLDLQELYQIRYALEGLAAFLAAERGPSEELISYAAAFQSACWRHSASIGKS
jgi:DNA-binding GntR family transcriptional regulator